jgi:ribosomal protein L20A (L18A)
MTPALFEVQGSFNTRGRFITFSKEITAENKDAAHEKVLCLLGSHHKVRRSQIEISAVSKKSLQEPKKGSGS